MTSLVLTGYILIWPIISAAILLVLLVCVYILFYLLQQLVQFLHVQVVVFGEKGDQFLERASEVAAHEVFQEVAFVLVLRHQRVVLVRLAEGEADVRKRVERSLRRNQVQPGNAGQVGDHEFATLPPGASRVPVGKPIPGTSVRIDTPNGASAPGSAPVTSAKPPVLISG